MVITENRIHLISFQSNELKCDQKEKKSYFVGLFDKERWSFLSQK